MFASPDPASASGFWHAKRNSGSMWRMLLTWIKNGRVRLMPVAIAEAVHATPRFAFAIPINGVSGCLASERKDGCGKQVCDLGMSLLRPSGRTNMPWLSSNKC